MESQSIVFENGSVIESVPVEIQKMYDEMASHLVDIWIAEENKYIMDCILKEGIIHYIPYNKSYLKTCNVIDRMKSFITKNNRYKY